MYIIIYTGPITVPSYSMGTSMSLYFLKLSNCCKLQRDLTTNGLAIIFKPEDFFLKTCWYFVIFSSSLILIVATLDNSQIFSD